MLQSDTTYLAVDLGASSGRVIAGQLLNETIEMEEVHRFSNAPVMLGNQLYWNFLYLFEEVKKGLKLAAQKYQNIISIGIDTWGVDFGLIDKQGNLMNNPVCYRDARTKGTIEKVFSVIDKREHYKETGIQSMEINTLFQLYSIKTTDEALLKQADKLLFTPDLLAYFLTGVASTEYSIASTSELLNVHQKDWSKNLINSLDFPEHLFAKIVHPGTVKGKLKKAIAQETGLLDATVVAIASHDTASAVLAIPSEKKQTAFISSGTWSLIGATVNQPILSKKAQNADFTNEGGLNSIRFLRNTTGLWILQQLVKKWQEKEVALSYPTLIAEAEATDFNTIIDVDDACFVNPTDMESAIVEYCKSQKMAFPTTRGDFVRCVLESLASKYEKAFANLQELLPEPITEIHIIGGGSQNQLLNQLTANKTKLPVVAGPVEATALGNILVQVMTANNISSIEKVKPLIMNSTKIKTFYPTK